MRTSLTKAIRAAFDFNTDTARWEFFQGFTTSINGSGLKLPCVWLTPVELVEKIGRDEGRMIYNVVLYFFKAQGAKYTEQDKEGIWTELESKANDGFLRMFDQDDIIEVTKLSCEPDEFAFTGFKEMSMKVTFKAMVAYCND